LKSGRSLPTLSLAFPEHTSKYGWLPLFTMCLILIGFPKTKISEITSLPDSEYAWTILILRSMDDRHCVPNICFSTKVILDKNPKSYFVQIKITDTYLMYIVSCA